MPLLLAAACVLTSVTSLQAGVVTVASILSNLAEENVNLNNSFVDEIKANLQNNNDDYMTETELNVGHEPLADTRRRYKSSEISEEETIDQKNTAFISGTTSDLSTTRKKHEHHITHSTKIKSTSESTATTTTTTVGSKATRNARVGNWKRLIAKSKRLRKYTSSPKIEPTPVMIVRGSSTTRSVPVARAPPPDMPKPKKKSRRPRPRQVNRNVLPLRSPGPIRKPPNAEQLDMAPARGAYIHDLRLKGRFCYRHVLWPEGPKYNSKGETIMPAFNGSLYSKKRSFFQTSKPSYMLPRCCNCCKKSVLGCQ